jgi:hypothetical protein
MTLLCHTDIIMLIDDATDKLLQFALKFRYKRMVVIKSFDSLN